MSNKTFEACCLEVAEKLGVKSCQVHPDTAQVLLEAAELYADRRMEEAMRWIPVSEKLPQKGQQVYVIGYREAELYTAAKEQSVGLVNWNTEKSSPCSDTCFYSFGYTNITHWMPIPEVPKPTQP